MVRQGTPNRMSEHRVALKSKSLTPKLQSPFGAWCRTRLRFWVVPKSDGVGNSNGW